ncbi:MAG: hypothetical protein WBN31_11320 [Gammaproteobacteria bacterium]
MLHLKPRWLIFTGVFLSCCIAAGCAGNQVNQVMNQGLKPGRESGLITNTILTKVSSGLERAWIYEIDGEHVSYTRRTFRLPAGEHTIKVWPLDNAPRSQQKVPDPGRILREEIVVEELTINIEPGYRYYLAARTNITRTTSTIAGTETYRFRPGKFIVPVVSREAPPADYVEGAKGLSLFFLSMAIPAAIMPAL